MVTQPLPVGVVAELGIVAARRVVGQVKLDVARVEVQAWLMFDQPITVSKGSISDTLHLQIC
jgi:hypothetical protein